MSIYKKIFEAKKSISAITKNSKNPHFKNTYFDINKLLSEVEPVLQGHELLLLQPIEDGKVKTIILDHESGEKIESEMKLPNIQEPQKLGGAITYFRRYTLQSLLGLQAEDDDANAASNYVTIPPKPKLTEEQFDACFSGTKDQIARVLRNFSLTKKQRDELTRHFDSL